MGTALIKLKTTDTNSELNTCGKSVNVVPESIITLPSLVPDEELSSTSILWFHALIASSVRK